MAGKTRVGGTNYKISGGKTRVGGTNYKISGGRTRVNGTGYDVPFSVTWEKYNCNTVTVWTMYPSSTNWGEWSYEREIDSTCGSYSSWEFSQSWGFSGVGYIGGKYIDNVGNYMVEQDRVSVIQSVVDNGDGTITITRKPIEVAYSNTTYHKGDTSYGKIEVDSDVQPEEGTILQQNTASGYCVIRVSDGTVYYYKKV